MFDNLVHLGDILAIPFFFALAVYFYQIKDKTRTEFVLMLFSIGGFIADMLFTLTWIFRGRRT